MKIKKIDATEGHLVYKLFNDYRIFYKQTSNLALARQFIQAQLDHKESVVFVALDDINTPNGFTQLYPKYSSMRATKNWILNDLFVVKENRKQGVGAALIRKAISFAAQNDATWLQLETATDNYAAQSLYEQIGFERQKPDTDFITYRIGVKI
ncbi:GNAT family N-acetyltransferase [Niabella insulamsoli]|uniref:GNAT family N-acetyltransferase n=1 Tax=Niabella insulamsoli TaxID=3144874 RepID=UPI0031FE4272